VVHLPASPFFTGIPEAFVKDGGRMDGLPGGWKKEILKRINPPEPELRGVLLIYSVF
jgi:hypothetical protein